MRIRAKVLDQRSHDRLQRQAFIHVFATITSS
jgi:hypothetical protein